MILKAKDTLFISSFSSENILPGGEFEVSDERGEDLIERGLATKVGASKAKKEDEKDKAAPEKKAVTLTKNGKK